MLSLNLGKVKCLGYCLKNSFPNFFALFSQVRAAPPPPKQHSRRQQEKSDKTEEVEITLV